MPASQAAMVGYYLRNTVSEHGTVTRGGCTHNAGKLTAVHETYKIRPFSDGTIRDTSSSEDGVLLDPHSLVSMNFWGFCADIFPAMHSYFEAFLRNIEEGNIKAECLLPIMVDALLKSKQLSVNVLATEDVWFGMTYPEDKPLVQQALKNLHLCGTYPAALINL